ncbi:methyl-accepting chemotaxis protein [Frateuria soli]|uniref:methyl-accepting chemotaxis protein n=1 Tax=Frateuria soli TaxID=1542730 RepID=UPI001E4CE78C|nr:PAS domain-containing methyl-accepting chemotaxis protein [Frateuria soli]UGB36847.1 methyl-accepting chemotaxis protein [Frateuria soli]
MLALPHALRRLLPARSADRLAAIDRVQAVIEFAPDGTIRDANALFLRTMGYTRAEIVGRHHRLFVLPEEAASDGYRQFWQRLREGRHDAGLYRRRARDGREVWLQSSYNPLHDRTGRVTGIVKFATDVTAQRQAAADLESRMQAIDRSQGVIEFALDGTIVAANANFLQALGYRAEEVVGRHHRMFVEPAEAARPEYQAFWQRLREGRHDAGVYRRVGKQGREVWIQATYNPVLDAAGQPARVIKFATDITAQTLAAKTLQREVQVLSSTVRESARHAVRANDAARKATETAGQGSQAMEAVIATMAGIVESTHSIGGILELIDSLAFQTNLLSLNAAIEAAQAGEHGRGFAVVADEVRQLAKRSRAASGEIRGLIEEARARVDHGTELVESTGRSMAEILSSIAEAHRLNGTISSSANAQASGIERVNAAVAQLEQVYGA